MCGVPGPRRPTTIFQTADRTRSPGSPVCEQGRDPAEARDSPPAPKSVSSAMSLRLVTPGTITRDRSALAATPNYLIGAGARAPRPAKRNMPSPGIDISTGAFHVRRDHGIGSALLSTSLRIDPRELILPSGLPGPTICAPAGRAGAGSPRRSRHNVLFRGRTRAARALLRLRHRRRIRSFSRPQAFGHRGSRRLCREDPEGSAAPAAPVAGKTRRTTLFIDAGHTRANFLEIMRTLSDRAEGSLFCPLRRPTVTGPGARLLGERLTSP